MTEVPPRKNGAADETASARFAYDPPRRWGRDIALSEIEANLARYEDLVEDRQVFPDLTEVPTATRRHYHVISPGSHLGPAAITTPHNFHMSILECPPGSGPPLHRHDLGEIFVCIKGRFAMIWGNDGEHRIELGPLDTFSVPLGIMRTFDNVGDEPGTLLVIYDGGGEVLGAISKRPEEGQPPKR